MWTIDQSMALRRLSVWHSPCRERTPQLGTSGEHSAQRCDTAPNRAPLFSPGMCSCCPPLRSPPNVCPCARKERGIRSEIAVRGKEVTDDRDCETDERQIVRSDLGNKHASMNRTHPIELLDHPIPRCLCVAAVGSDDPARRSHDCGSRSGPVATRDMTRSARRPAPIHVSGSHAASKQDLGSTYQDDVRSRTSYEAEVPPPTPLVIVVVVRLFFFVDL